MKPQTERVLRQLRLHPQGLNETAFAAPFVIDGGLPIQRVAARIYELKQLGFDIRTRRLSNGTASYVLISEPAAGEAATDRAA